jgi:hypothetical protein
VEFTAFIEFTLNCRQNCRQPEGLSRRPQFQRIKQSPILNSGSTRISGTPALPLVFPVAYLIQMQRQTTERGNRRPDSEPGLVLSKTPHHVADLLFSTQYVTAVAVYCSL